MILYQVSDGLTVSLVNRLPSAVRNHASWSSSLPSLNLNSVHTCFDSAIRLLLILNSSQNIRTPLFSHCWIVLLVTLGLSELSRLFNF